jgi:hypothetical protein
MFLAMWILSALIGTLAGGVAYLFLRFFVPGAEWQRDLAFWAFAAVGVFYGLFGASWFMIRNWTQTAPLRNVRNDDPDC